MSCSQILRRRSRSVRVTRKIVGVGTEKTKYLSSELSDGAKISWYECGSLDYVLCASASSASDASDIGYNFY